MRENEVREYLESWVIHLEAERKSPNTIRTYTAGVDAWLRWCAEDDTEPGLTRSQFDAFTAARLRAGAEAATVLSRQRGIRMFSAWLADEGHIPANELAHVKPPKLDQKVPPELTAEQILALVATCAPREFHDVRDEAIIRLMVDSMVRADELLSMQTGEVHIREKSALVRRGKGGKGRIVAYGPKTARALDRYMHARKRQRTADLEEFWLSARNRGPLTYDALYYALRRRAERCGFSLHPHVLRSTGAIRWREKGGSVASLLTVAGWSSLEMAARYVRHAENRLAIEEAHRLGLNDDL